MALKLSYCQLVKIILAQIGGSPLQQVYTQLSQGYRQITTRGALPTEFQQISALVTQVTDQLNALTGDINAMSRMAQQFFYNPVGTVTTETIGKIDERLAQIDELLADPLQSSGDIEQMLLDEKDKLNGLRTELVNFKTHTDTLTGVVEPNTANGFGGCTLADLLGDGCKPASDLPDVNLQVLIDGLKSGAVIEQLKQNLINRIAGNLGLPELLLSVNSLKTSVSNFNDVITSKLNKAIIQRAVENYINFLVFNLLSGCSNELLNATLIPSVKQVLTPYAAYQQKILEGKLNQDGSTPGTATETL